MNVRVVSKEGFSDSALISVRAGNVRRQVPITSGKSLQFGHLEPGTPLKVDILQPVGSGYLVLKPGTEGQYMVVFDAPGCACELGVAAASSEGGGNATSMHNQDPVGSGSDGKEFLESHQILQFVKGVLQVAVKERPDDPYAFLVRHLMSGYKPIDSRLDKAALVKDRRSGGTRRRDSFEPVDKCAAKLRTQSVEDELIQSATWNAREALNSIMFGGGGEEEEAESVNLNFKEPKSQPPVPARDEVDPGGQPSAIEEGAQAPKSLPGAVPPSAPTCDKAPAGVQQHVEQKAINAPGGEAAILAGSPARALLRSSSDSSLAGRQRNTSEAAVARLCEATLEGRLGARPYDAFARLCEASLDGRLLVRNSS